MRWCAINKVGFDSKRSTVVKNILRSSTQKHCYLAWRSRQLSHIKIDRYALVLVLTFKKNLASLGFWYRQVKIGYDHIETVNIMSILCWKSHSNIFDVYFYFQLQNKKRGGCRCNAKRRSRNDGQLGPAKPLPAEPLPAELFGRAEKRNFWPAGDYKLTSSES